MNVVFSIVNARRVSNVSQIFRVTTQMGEWNSLTFPGELKKKFQPSNMHVYWPQSMKNEIKNAIETNSKAIS